MLVRNASLANSEMILRSNGRTVQSDANGVFEVPEQDGRFLLSTGRPWEQWNGPFTKPVPKGSVPPGAPEEMVRQFEEAVAGVRAELEGVIAQRDARIAELEGQLAEALAKLESVPPPAPPSVLTAHEIVPPAPAAGDDAPSAEDDEEIDLNTLEMPELLELAKEYGLKVQKSWDIERVRKELAAKMF